MAFITAEIIKKKRNGVANSKEEISYMVEKYTLGEIPDYQMAAWLMTIYFQNMSAMEATALTQTMLHSGETLKLDHIDNMIVDKHSTGGVGDKTSLILAPLVAAAGITVPMISGRALGHTGGTLDKLESIPGYNTQISLEIFYDLLKKHGVAMIGQTPNLCPADKKIYALRDVTATVESLPLICASIMSKKLAADLDALVLDVKYGSGAFMKTFEHAEELATSLMEIGKHSGVKVAALITNMNQPLGRWIGNSLEIEECLSILKNDDRSHLYEDCRHLSLELAGHMIWLGGKASSAKEGYQVAASLLQSGKGYEKFCEIIASQGGRLKDLPRAQHKKDIFLSENGYVSFIQTEAIGYAAIVLGAGRTKSSDPLDYTAGIEIHHKVGELYDKSQPFFTIYGNQKDKFLEAEARLKQVVQLSKEKMVAPPLIAKYLLP